MSTKNTLLVSNDQENQRENGPEEIQQELTQALSQPFPVVTIPTHATNIRDGIERNSDSSVFVDEEQKAVYKHYQCINPRGIHYYHLLQNAASTASREKDNPVKDEFEAADIVIDKIKIAILPLDPKKVYSDGKDGSITTPTYVEGETLDDKRYEHGYNSLLFRARIGEEIADDIKNYIKKEYNVEAPHIAIAPANVKMRLKDKTLFLLITDISSKVTDLVYNKRAPGTENRQKEIDILDTNRDSLWENLELKEKKLQETLGKASISYELPEAFR